MPVDGLALSAIIAPIVLVIGAIWLLPAELPMQRPWARYLIFAVVWLIVGRYMAWRLFDTVIPADGEWYELAWIYLSFAIETIALGDALILYLAFVRTSDRRSEADKLEAAIRARDPATLPSVDVYIATYNEPLSVLEKTIVGALALDYPNFNVWVLDDGRREWLRDFCLHKGAGYITRPDNRHAKAGNINHALTQTAGDYVAIFDADFIPQRNFLMRTIGFFADPKIGIVQVPHAFYNHDPMQANLALRKTLPDDQRFFFEAIMPSRDGWDAAFCCGSNSVTRRSALRQVGDGLPTGSITEDMLLSLAMLRQGFVTRYLCEHLAFGLAPESVKAFFVQRQRWARGATQILYLPEGPLGHGLRFMHRLLFLPTHWLTQGLTMVMTIVAPLVFLWTGLPPLVNVTTESAFHYLLPMVFAIVGGLTAYAPGRYFPLAAQVLGTFQSFKILPTVLQTLVRPHGHLFKVTPKGSDAHGPGYERGIFTVSLFLMIATLGGVVINSIPEWRIVEQSALIPLVAFWSIVNVIVLFLVCMMCLQAPVRRGEERFAVDEPTWVRGEDGSLTIGRIEDLSITGVGIKIEGGLSANLRKGCRVRVFIGHVGFVNGTTARLREGLVGVQFDLPESVERDLLIRKIFTSGSTTLTASSASVLTVTFAMLQRIWAKQPSAAFAPLSEASEPEEKRLPKETLVIQPRPPRHRLDALAAERATLAA